MSSKRIYIEGGGDAKDLATLCRKGFCKLLEKCGFTGRLPKLIACGGRAAAFDDFRLACAHAKPGDYIALLIDSEDPVADIERPWEHLKSRDNWDKPAGTREDQVLLMTTCMETWIVADRAALHQRYPDCLQENALPNLNNLETRDRHGVLKSLKHSTRTCNPPYTKGAESFRLVAVLDPEELKQHLPSFARAVRVLGENL